MSRQRNLYNKEGTFHVFRQFSTCEANCKERFELAPFENLLDKVEGKALKLHLIFALGSQFVKRFTDKNNSDMLEECSNILLNSQKGYISIRSGQSAHLAVF